MRIPWFSMLMLAVPLLAVMPWAAVQMDVALNINHAWLTIAAERLLAGGSMAADFAETNPPLAVIVYVFPVLLTTATGLPVYYGPALMGFVCLALSTLFSALLLRRITPLSEGPRAAILAAYVMGSTYLAGNWNFADRDELVLWGLFPFLLLQICLTMRVAVPRRLSWPLLAFGTFFILLKPHYGLLPVIVMLHRMIVQKRLFSIMRDGDFIALTAGVLCYAALLLSAFRGYTFEILPEIITGYITLKNPLVPLWSLQIFAVLAGIGVAAKLLEVPLNYRRPLYLFVLAACVALGLYLLQMKGFFYHQVVIRAFSFCAAGLLLQGLLVKFFGAGRVVLLASVVLIVAGAAILSPPYSNAVTHEDYKQTPLAQLVGDCAPDCSYFAITENMKIVLQLDLYTGATYASRFPVLWWLPALIPGSAQHIADPAATEARLEKHIVEVAADIARYKPELIIALKNRPLFNTQGQEDFNYIALFRQYPAFAAEMEHYTLSDTIEDQENAYFYKDFEPDPDPYVYEIYRRKPQAGEK